MRVEPKVLLSLLTTHTLLWVSLQQTTQQITKQRVVHRKLLTLKVQLLSQNIINRLAEILRSEGSHARYHLVKRDSHRPIVYLLRIPAPQEHFGCFIIVGAGVGEHFLVSTAQLHILTNSKIYYFYHPRFLVKQNIIGLYVSVADMFFVNVL